MLITVSCALENAVCLHAACAAIPPFSEMVDKNFAKALFKDRKQALNARFNSLSNAREVLNEIDDQMEELPDLPVTPLDVAPLLTSSVVRLLRAWFAEQKEIYKNNAAQLFVPAAQNRGTKSNNIKPVQHKISTQKQKEIALRRIAFLSGYNRMNVKILSNDDFLRLTTCITTLIETGTLPRNIQPIAQTGISNEYLRYTFYLIHKELYTTRPIRPEWIDLLHALFLQFKEVEKETTRKKFSLVPTHYHADIQQIVCF